MALIELEQVSRHYALDGVTVRALQDVSLRIDAGEMVAIMGASGSGKSTLMNLLGCLDKPTAGRLTVDGHDLAALSSDRTSALRRDTFGFVFQRYHLLAHLDAVGNVELPAIYAGHGRRERRRRAIALLQRLGLGDRLGHKPSALSGGQQQRVSIARALMNGGRIILADEPTGALDRSSGAEMLALLAELNAAGHTVILVTHDDSVAAHARRVIELSDGRIVRDSRAPEAATAAPPPAPVAAPPAARGALQALARAVVPWREAVAMGWRALNGSRLRSALSMLGISIGIAAVVSIMALSGGMRAQIQDSLDRFATNHFLVSKGNLKLPPGAVARPFTPGEQAALRALPGVTAVEASYVANLPARHGQRDANVYANGSNPGDLARSNEAIVLGRDLRPQDIDSAAKVAVLNDKARDALFTADEPVLGRQVMVGPLTLTVVGVSESRLPTGPAPGAIYLPQSTYTSQIDTRPVTDALSVHFDSRQDAEALLAQVQQRLRALHGGVEDFSVSDGLKIRRSLDAVLATVGRVLTAIASISLLVGGVGVMNIMLVSVSERTREIGIRRAVGARQSDVQRQFLIESVLLCCLGGLAGLALPWLATLAINSAGSGLQLSLSWDALALALGTCTLIGLLFGNMPARHAATLSPVAALARD